MVAGSVPADSDGEIFRVTKSPDNPYAQIARAMLEDERLTFACRGLLAYLFAKPADWRILIKDLWKRSPKGRDHIYGLLEEAERFGYYSCHKTRGDGGQFHWKRAVYESPDLNPYYQQVAPLPENPEVASDNHFLKIRKSGSNTKKNNKEGRLSPDSNNHGGLRRRAPVRELRRPARESHRGTTGRGILFEALFRIQELDPDPAVKEHDFAEIDTCQFISKLHGTHRGVSDDKLAEMVREFPDFASEHVYAVKMGSKITIKIISDYWTRFYKWIEAGRPAPAAPKTARPAVAQVGAHRNGWHERWEASLRQEIADPANQPVKGNLESLLLSLNDMSDEAEAITAYGKVRR